MNLNGDSMKRLKFDLRKISLLLLALYLFIFSTNVFAEGGFTYEEYIKNVKEGYIAEDVKYEDMLKLINESAFLEKN